MLPVFLSIPHGGTETPKELHDRICITPQDLFDDGDAFTADVYDLSGEVAGVVKAEIARAFVDLNRAPEDRPPQNPDGVVKTATCLNRPIYKPGREPDEALTALLIERYHGPYHARLEAAGADPRIRLALDCHSMLPTAPPIAPDAGRRRPLFCLSNGNGRTAPTQLLEALAAAFAAAFEVPREEIGLNDPFKGGYITQRHGGGRLPWIQVEMNRSLYLAGPWFDRDTRQIHPGRLENLRDRFRDALQRVRP